MGFIEIYLLTYGLILLCMTFLWLLSVRLKDASIVDIFWGTGFVIANGVYFILADGYPTRKVILLVLVTVWGLRLTIHLGRRNLGKGEDYRYQAFRKRWGAKYWWVSFFQTFLLQGTLMWLISIPLLVGQFVPVPANLTIFDILGILIWTVGFLFESIGDWQLTRFKADPLNKGKVLDSGLWRYTRHPNYFGDAVVWWGYFCIALAVPWGILSFYGPLLMTIFLVRVSGVAMLERSLKKTKPEYADYIARTSAFFPLPPRRKIDSID